MAFFPPVAIGAFSHSPNYRRDTRPMATDRFAGILQGDIKAYGTAIFIILCHWGTSLFGVSRSAIGKKCLDIEFLFLPESPKESTSSGLKFIGCVTDARLVYAQSSRGIRHAGKGFNFFAGFIVLGDLATGYCQRGDNPFLPIMLLTKDADHTPSLVNALRVIQPLHYCEIVRKYIQSIAIRRDNTDGQIIQRESFHKAIVNQSPDGQMISRSVQGYMCIKLVYEILHVFIEGFCHPRHYDLFWQAEGKSFHVNKLPRVPLNAAEI